MNFFHENVSRLGEVLNALVTSDLDLPRRKRYTFSVSLVQWSGQVGKALNREQTSWNEKKK